MRQFELDTFAAHLAEASVAVPLALNAGLNHVATAIERTAKAKIGEYQGESGPFIAWQPLADSTVEEKERLGYAPPDNPLLREGDLRESIKHEVGLLEAVIGSESPIAGWQEFGTDRIPPRPFIGPAAFENKELIVNTLGLAVMRGISYGRAIPSGLYDFHTGE